MSNQSRDAEDTMGRSESEMERLMKQFTLYDDITRRLFLRSGIAKGMKVLDVGTRGGEVARMLSEFVGAEGTVIGVDLNADILETAKARAKQAGVTNIEFIAGDIRTLELPNDFDAVAGRLVLMYMAAPTDVLKHLATHVRPGGIVVFQEVDFTPYTVVHPDTPLMNDLIEWERTLCERTGAHVDMGMELYKAFVDAGLPEPALHFEAPMGGPENWPGFGYFEKIVRHSTLPTLEAYEIATADEVDVDTLAERLQAEVASSKRPIMLPPRITAYATLPR
jgi:ubiquinone/menaquinone biosynthesis C-methylase UbiE